MACLSIREFLIVQTMIQVFNFVAFVFVFATCLSSSLNPDPGKKGGIYILTNTFKPELTTTYE
jgi:hypothetical protein